MKTRFRSQKLVSEINITPFTDVILVLLIIFMVSTPLIFQSSIKVTLPQAATNQEPPRTVNITISAEGDCYLENTAYSIRRDLGVFKYKLAALMKNVSDSSVIISGDKNVKYDFVVKVIDVVSQVGIKHIVLSTELKR